MRDKDQASPRSSRSRSNTPASNTEKKRSASKDSKSSRSKSKSRSRSRSARSYSSERDEYRLHIGDIGDHVRKSDLEKVFSQYGELKELWLTHSAPIFGFAVFTTKEAASTALKSADGVSVCGSRIRVTHARPRTRGQGRRFFHPNMRCYQCGYTGHFYRDCPDMDSKGYDHRSGGRRNFGRRGDRDRDYYSERDYGRRNQRSSRRYEEYDGGRRNSSRRYSRY